MNKAAVTSSLSIYIYTNHLDYLRAWLKIARRYRITRRSILEAGGINSPSLLSDILAGRKKLGVNQAAAVSNALGLQGDQADYFALLVELDRERDLSRKRSILESLQRIREKNLSKVLSKKNLEYFALWHYPLIREFIIGNGYAESAHEIAAALQNVRLRAADIEAALKKLVQWDMIWYDESSGRYLPCDNPPVLTYGDIPHCIVNDVKRDMLLTSIIAMENQSREDRHISMAIKSISRAKYKRFARKVDELRKEFLETDDTADGPSDRVAILNMQLFPVAGIEIRNNDHERE
jgi:uncharacterized protein (TIGR02147 family)